MSKHSQVAKLVAKAYEQAQEDFGQWMWSNHVPIVAQITEELSEKYSANADIAVAGAWLHDFGDAFVYRFHEKHDEISEKKALEVLQQAGYSDSEVEKVMQEVIAPHSCRDNTMPTTIEGKVMATADALAHLTTDFYLQFAWKHIPEGKTYHEFLEWVSEKLDRDFNKKIFFEEIQQNIHGRYDALIEVFVKK